MKKPKKYRRPNPLKERGGKGLPIEALMLEALEDLAMMPLRDTLRREKASPSEILLLSAALPVVLRGLRTVTATQQLPTDQLTKEDTIQ